MTLRDVLGEECERIMAEVAENLGIKLDAEVYVNRSTVFKKLNEKCMCGKEVYAHGLCKAHYMSGEF